MDVPSTDEKRLGKFDRIFTYMIGAEGAFITTVPREEIGNKTEAQVSELLKKKILAERGEITKWIGKEIAV